METDTQVFQSKIIEQNSLFSKLVMHERLITNEILLECQQEIDPENPQHLEDVLVQKNYLTHEMIVGIYIKSKLLHCPFCHYQKNLEEKISSLGQECSNCLRKYFLPRGYPFVKKRDNVTKSMKELCGGDWANYRIQYCLGNGGMGEVYRAIQKGLNRPIALKVLSPQMANNPQIVKRFEKEARLAAQITHPNLVQIYDVGNCKDYHYIAMEYINGQTLQSKISKDAGVLIKTAIHYLYESAKGIKALHEREIIHRDIKPDNIMISNDGLVKVTDFGLAKFEGDSQALTKHGAIIGTPYYMAPEQCVGKEATKVSDIYSLGLTFYYMIHGNLPYKGESTLEIITERINNPSPSLKVELPHKIAEIYRHMTSENHEKRYQSIDEVIAVIENLTEKDFIFQKAAVPYLKYFCIFVLLLLSIFVIRKKSGSQKRDKETTTIIEKNIPIKTLEISPENKTNSEEKIQDNPVIKEEFPKDIALEMFSVLEKKSFDSTQKKLQEYKFFMEKYPNFSQKELVLKSIDVMAKTIALNNKTLEYIDLCEQNQWKFLFEELSDDSFFVPSTDVKGLLEDKYLETWQKLKANVELIRNIKTTHNLQTKKNSLVLLKNQNTNIKWHNKIENYISEINLEMDLLNFWEQHFFSLQKTVRDRKYDEVKPFLSQLEKKLQTFKNSKSYRHIYELFQDEKRLLEDVVDLWYTYLNNIHSFLKPGEYIRPKETPTKDVANKAYMIYKKEEDWVQITFFCILEGDLELAEKSWRKVTPTKKNVNVVLLYEKYISTRMNFNEVIAKEELINKEDSELENENKIKIPEDKNIDEQIKEIFESNIKKINGKYVLRYNIEDEEEMEDFDKKIFGQWQHKALWENDWQLQIGLKKPIWVKITIEDNIIDIFANKEGDTISLKSKNLNDIVLKNSLGKRNTVNLQVKIKNKQIYIFDSEKLLIKRPYRNRVVSLNVHRFLNEKQISFIVIQGLFDNNWLQQQIK